MATFAKLRECAATFFVGSIVCLACGITPIDAAFVGGVLAVGWLL